MAFSTGNDSGGPMSEINVTPLVDVMLVLLIIFMITAPLMSHKIKVELAKLSAEDRALAEKQKFCVVLKGSRLGSMGPPVKITVRDRAVFLCCASCRNEARDNPARTLAELDRLLKK